ncbi:MAG: hypothetical protein R3C10_24585 [Pirellulales bacterium]
MVARQSRTVQHAGATGRDGRFRAAETGHLERAPRGHDEQFYAIDANIVDLGYVYDVRQRRGTVTVVITMPHRGRPVYEFLVDAGGGRVDEGIPRARLSPAGRARVVVKFTWQPPWTPARMTDAGRQMLGMDT